jgi:dienelactone hydrolase
MVPVRGDAIRNLQSNGATATMLYIWAVELTRTPVMFLSTFHEPQLSACVVNYGTVPTNPADIEKIRAPVLGNFGALDRGIPPVKVRTFERAMKRLNKSVDIIIYPGAGHGFQDPASARRYHPEATADSWLRILALLAQAKGTNLKMRPESARIRSVACGRRLGTRKE